MKFYLTIPVFNRKDYLRNCLLSLRKQTVSNFQVIVTDDGSTDGTAEMLADEFPEVWVHRGDGELYWTAAINRAISMALEVAKEEDFILALNDDLEVPEDYIEGFQKCLEANPKSLIGSVVTHFDDRDLIASGGVHINWFTAKIRGINNGKRLADFPKGFVQEVSYLTGRGVVIPVEVFRKYGLYKEHHYKQCGDPELPVRAANKGGYKLLVSYDVPVFSHVFDEGHINHQQQFSIASIKKYYFNIRSNMNLSYRWWFAIDATKNPVHGLWYFLMDFVRITGHFVKKLSR